MQTVSIKIQLLGTGLMDTVRVEAPEEMSQADIWAAYRRGELKEIDPSLKYFVEGKKSGWIGPFETEELARNFIWDHLEEATRVSRKRGDFEGDITPNDI